MTRTVWSLITNLNKEEAALKKMKNRSGFSLIEMLAAIAILSILVTGMGSGINAGVHAYGDAVFYANSRTMGDIVSTALSDVLRYGDRIRICPESGFTTEDASIVVPKEKTGFVVSNYEYGVINGYFEVLQSTDGRNLVYIQDLQNSEPKLLVNTGAYPDLEVKNLKITYEEAESYFDLSFDIFDVSDESQKHEVKTTVRLLNSQTDNVRIANPTPNPGHNPNQNPGDNNQHGGNDDSSSGGGSVNNPCKHDYKVISVDDATCMKPEMTNYECSLCGNKKSEKTGEALGHDFTNGRVEPVNPATCTEKGLSKHYCSRCDKEYEEVEEPALGHDLSKKGEPVNPTCTENGYTRYSCSRCEYFEDKDIKEPLGHDYVVTEEKATCTEAGKKTSVCSRCNDTKTETVGEPLGHDLPRKGTVIPPTCTEQGCTRFSCSRCDYHLDKNIKQPLGHKYGKPVETPATCTSPKLKTSVCSVCGDEKVQKIGKPISHHWGEWTVIKEATLTEEGKKTRSCTYNCGTTETEIIPKLEYKVWNRNTWYKTGTIVEHDGKFYVAKKGNKNQEPPNSKVWEEYAS